MIPLLALAINARALAERAKDALPAPVRTLWETSSIRARRLALRQIYEAIDELVKRGEI